jgi:3-hydroxybutyryl-CoA dehydrogenase
MREVERVGVIGAGLMGTGIAVKFALKGYPTSIVDVDDKRIAEIPATADRVLATLGEAGLVKPEEAAQARELLDPGTSYEGLAEARWVIEAVPEVLSLKHEVYRQAEAVLADDAIIASNTSGLMPSRLVQALRRKERFLVAHFWNPPYAIPLVEVVPAAETSREVLQATESLLRSIEMQPVLLRQELPGFIGNRLQYAVLREALNIVRSGAAGPEEVDLVMKASLGRRYATTGPLETADLGGLDTFLTIASHLMPELAKDEDVLDLMRERVSAGHTGWRSGQGFYSWTPERFREVIGRRDRDLLARLEMERKNSDEHA